MHYTRTVDNKARCSSLDKLEIGRTALISEIKGERSFRRRLLELGLLPGTKVSVLRIAPLGDPLELATRSGCLSIRRRDAAQISVEDLS